MHFPGERPGAAALMSALDVLVISSRTEGTPMVLLEAMSAGVPVVSFSVGGIPNVLNDEAGWLVTPGDPHALAEAIRQVLLDPAEAKRRASRARAIVATRFGIDQWISSIDALYRSILASYS
jgi:glycosyltransferase involved in cell wall biosynthesis